MVLWPTEVLNYMVKLIGAVFFVIGVISLVMSYQNREERAAMGLSSFSGIGSVILGIVLWAMSDFFTSMLMWLFGLLLLVAGDGRRLSKRERDLDLGALRERGVTAERLVGALAAAAGLADPGCEATPSELVAGFSWERLRREDIVVDDALLAGLL